MPIEPANRPYDPQDRRRRDNVTELEGEWRYVPPPAPRPEKPGVSFGLLAWTLAGAALTITAVIITAINMLI
jgi:hypothetical protein